MVVIDGARGEGGGQVLRTGLCLSLLTGRPVRFENIRAGRSKPGLLRQHLTAVRAAAAVGRAKVEGDALGSRALSFRPTTRAGGDHHFAVGSAGSATLVLQTVLPALLAADGPARVVLEGGTHNPWAPPFPFLADTFLPALERMGARVSATLERAGFFPAGGGRFVVEVAPGALQPLSLLERGPLTVKRAVALVANLPRGVGERELARVQKRLGVPEASCSVIEIPSPGPGNALHVHLGFDGLTETFSAFGRKGIRAEQVADDAVDEARAWLAAEVPVGPHLADQLMLPLALAGGGGFRTLAPTGHATTQIESIGQFLDVALRLERESEKVWRFEVG
jgi:RNA 3'-terminal phosphate cyclase (ATP)